MANQVIDDPRRDIHRASTWSIVLSVLIIAAGILAIVVPATAGTAVTLTVGWLFIFSGALHIAFAWAAGRAGAVIGEVLIGALYGIVGFYLIANPLLGVEALTFAIATYLLLEAAFEFVIGYMLRFAPGSAAGWLVFDGVVTVLLAVAIFAGWPGNSFWALGTLAGVSMIVSGLARLIVSAGVRRMTA